MEIVLKTTDQEEAECMRGTMSGENLERRPLVQLAYTLVPEPKQQKD